MGGKQGIGHRRSCPTSKTRENHRFIFNIERPALSVSVLWTGLPSQLKIGCTSIIGIEITSRLFMVAILLKKSYFLNFNELNKL